MRIWTIALFTIGVAAATAHAQTTLVRIPYRTYVAINPLAIPFDIGSAEIESAIAPGFTVGALASYSSLDDRRYTTFDAKLRYYPNEVVLRAFSLGVSVGHTHVTTKSSGPAGEELRPKADFPTLGFLVDYNWMLGARHRFILASGVGVKRVLADAAVRDRVGVEHAYATVRFAIGIAF